MSQTIASLDRKIKVADDLHTVVRTMKAVAASKIGQYEKSLHSSSEYYHAIELGLGACLRKISTESGAPISLMTQRQMKQKNIGVVVFGSDQGLVGQFNDIAANHAFNTLNKLSGKQSFWAVGERVRDHLVDLGLDVVGTFVLPNSVSSIATLIGQILIETKAHNIENECNELYLIYNHKTLGSGYEPNSLRILPLDKMWQRDLVKCQWPTNNLPEVMGNSDMTLKSFIREYLFVSIFRACTESLVSENASRLSAMQRADKNIEELLENLNGTFHRLRQGSIDEELFDVVSGFEALSDETLTRKRN